MPLSDPSLECSLHLRRLPGTRSLCAYKYIRDGCVRVWHVCVLARILCEQNIYTTARSIGRRLLSTYSVINIISEKMVAAIASRAIFISGTTSAGREADTCPQ